MFNQIEEIREILETAVAKSLELAMQERDALQAELETVKLELERSKQYNAGLQKPIKKEKTVYLYDEQAKEACINKGINNIIEGIYKITGKRLSWAVLYNLYKGNESKTEFLGDRVGYEDLSIHIPERNFSVELLEKQPKRKRYNFIV